MARTNLLWNALDRFAEDEEVALDSVIGLVVGDDLLGCHSLRESQDLLAGDDDVLQVEADIT